MSKKDKKPVKIIEKKLGREKAWGQFFIGKNIIELDPRMTSKRYLNTLIHELLHYMYPTDSETRVCQNADFLTKHIWDKNYRRISK